MNFTNLKLSTGNLGLRPLQSKHRCKSSRIITIAVVVVALAILSFWPIPWSINEECIQPWPTVDVIKCSANGKHLQRHITVGTPRSKLFKGLPHYLRWWWGLQKLAKRGKEVRFSVKMEGWQKGDGWYFSRHEYNADIA